MGLSLSLVLAAVGAILIWAVDASVSGVSLTAVGVILLIVGCIGVVLSMIYWASWGGFGGTTRTRDTTVIQDRHV